jgi:prophage regulatory protein
MADTVLRFPRVKERVGGLSKSWIYQEITEGRFPTPIKLGGRAVGWLQSEVDAWLSDRIERSRRRTEDAAATGVDAMRMCAPSSLNRSKASRARP